MRSFTPHATPPQNLRIRRVYDDKNKVVIYVAFSTRFTGGARGCNRGCVQGGPTSLCGGIPSLSLHLAFVMSSKLPLPPCGAALEEKDLSTSRYRTSVCAVPVSAAPALVPVANEAASN